MLRHVLAAGSNLSSQVMSPNLSTNETFDLRRPACRLDKGKDKIIETQDGQALTRLENLINKPLRLKQTRPLFATQCSLSCRTYYQI